MAASFPRFGCSTCSDGHHLPKHVHEHTKPEIEGVVVVLLGSFNPSIIQPAWLARHGLILDAESEEAQIVLIRPEITQFVVGPFVVHADFLRFKVETVEMGHDAALRDLVTGIFETLAETPVTHFGINLQMHFRVESHEIWHALGHRLVSKDIYEGLLEEPGTQTVTVRGRRAGSPAEYCQIQVEPSTKLSPGVYATVNEHFPAAQGQSARDLMAVLAAEWDPSLSHARWMAETMIERAQGKT